MKAEDVVKKVEKKTQIESELLANEIKRIAAAMQGLTAGPLKRHTIVLLVSKSSGVNLHDAQRVLDAIESLDKHYLK